ncbi:hypothetical protein BCR41DRAFT_395274 [Lobosporangium transversale]|uniref:Uncharacterized protein n=1 Tax=Lobosporangium transversale TaxID=64571 RepID=A0A1Y2GQG3_9FUNG|nr:hypothetical protein BCR41DRAFT_395274 [Lobosporangium transversale]ORZ19138.1 hypothetical protein BCR41DRAFT_395274 [Lobosporangium transversale]|eukprot:XP_021882306.1 hypothetical protein BCR41DRAFT_395274 [Lobosporangium transversale]
MEIVDDSVVVELSSVELGEDLVKPQHIQDWDDIKNDPGTEGELGDETEEEDWIMRVCSNNDFWQKLQPQMQEAAKAVKTTKAYAGTSRSAIFRKNQRLKTAAMGTPSLTSIGFIGISKEPAESSTNNHNQQQTISLFPKALSSVDIITIRKYARKCFRYMDAYRKNMSGQVAEQQVKKYRSHRRIPANWGFKITVH